MPNHPNRGRGGPSANPNPTDVIALREGAGLTQSQAAAMVHSGLRTWQQWEAGDRRMHPGLWELFRLKIQAPIDRSPHSASHDSHP